MATCNQFDDATLRTCVQRAEEIARLAPESPEYMPCSAPRNTWPRPRASPRPPPPSRPITAPPRWAAAWPSATRRSVSSAAFLNDSAGFVAKRNSKGLEAYQQLSAWSSASRCARPTAPARATPRPTTTTPASSTPRRLTRIAADKAAGSRNAKALEPGKYTVILEPAALVANTDASLLQALMSAIDARNADEGRSFLSKKGGGNRKGEKLFDERVTIYSDPTNAEVPDLTFLGRRPAAAENDLD